MAIIPHLSYQDMLTPLWMLEGARKQLDEDLNLAHALNQRNLVSVEVWWADQARTGGVR